MELYCDRVINGVLKSVPHVIDPGQAYKLLDQDIEIIADRSRTTEDDLWPCVWALAAVLSRQTFGSVFIRCGLKEALTSPAPLPASCVFTDKNSGGSLRIGVGVEPQCGGIRQWGDARGGRISFGRLIEICAPANAVSGFALAGYLGFAALARLVGIPPFREQLSHSDLSLPFGEIKSHPGRGSALTFIGLGHLGNAVLAIFHFLARRWNERPTAILVDKGDLEEGNDKTHILVGDAEARGGEEKALVLERTLHAAGWLVRGEVSELVWGWQRPQSHPRLVFLGFDNFDARRMGVEAEYDWVVEAGVGSSFIRPRVTWHSMPPDRNMARRIFPRAGEMWVSDPDHEKQFFNDLRRTPGECGWVTFKGVVASAPSMGLIAAAYAWTEMLRVLNGEKTGVAGSAYIWSPFLPFLRQSL